MLPRRALLRTLFPLCIALACLVMLNLFAFSPPLYAQQSTVTLNPGESVTIECVGSFLSGYPGGASSETVVCGNGTPPAALGSQQGYIYLAPTNRVTVQGNNCNITVAILPNHDWNVSCGGALPAAPTNTPVPAGPTCGPFDLDAFPAGTLLTKVGDVTFTVQQGVAGKVVVYPTNNSNWPETDLDVENVGNVLVFPEVVTVNSQGLADPVGDNSSGGKLLITFGAPRKIETITFGDDETGGKATVELFGANGSLGTFTSPKTGNATAVTQSVNVDNVTSMAWTTTATTNLKFTSACSAPPAPPPAAPTNTPIVPPTNTPVVPPTNTPIVAPTDTPVVPPTNTPVVVPTNTPAVLPTNTPVVVPNAVPLSPGAFIYVQGVNCALQGTAVDGFTESFTCGDGTAPASMPSQANWLYVAPNSNATVQGNNCTLIVETIPGTNTFYLQCSAALGATNTPTPAGGSGSGALGQDDALAYLNSIRQQMGLSPVVIDATLSDSALRHSHYLIDNAANISDYHSEDLSNKDYTADGAAVAGNSDIDPTCFGTWMQPMKDWLQGPLHTVGLIDPSLDSIGLGSDLSQFQNGNCAYVLGFHFKYPPVGNYPIYYPPKNGTHQFLAWDGAEGSAPFQFAKNCTGSEKGPAVFLKDAANIQLSDVTSASFAQGDTATNGTSCVGVYFNWIYLMPPSPLSAGTKYTVSITSHGNTYTWSFNAAGTPPPTPAPTNTPLGAPTNTPTSTPTQAAVASNCTNLDFSQIPLVAVEQTVGDISFNAPGAAKNGVRFYATGPNSQLISLRQTNFGNVMIYPDVFHYYGAFYDVNQTGGTVIVTFGTPRLLRSARLVTYGSSAGNSLVWQNTDNQTGTINYSDTNPHPNPDAIVVNVPNVTKLTWTVSGPGALAFDAFCPDAVPAPTNIPPPSNTPAPTDTPTRAPTSTACTNLDFGDVPGIVNMTRSLGDISFSATPGDQDGVRFAHTGDLAFNATLRQSNIGNVIIFPVLDPNSADLNQTGGTVTITFGTPRYLSSVRLVTYSAAASTRLYFTEADGSQGFAPIEAGTAQPNGILFALNKSNITQLTWQINGPGALQFTAYCPGTVPTATPTPTLTPTPAAASQDVISGMIAAINAQRKSEAPNCPQLVEDAGLDKIAQQHTDDMANNQGVTLGQYGGSPHNGSDGSTINSRISSVYPRSPMWSEVVNFGTYLSTPSGTVADWVAMDPGHHQALINCNWTKAGVGYRYAVHTDWQHNYLNYWTVDFVQ